MTVAIVICDFNSRSSYVLNLVRLPDSRERGANCELWPGAAADYYQSQPCRGFTASSVDFHWAENSARESNQSAVDATRWGRRAGSRGASSDRPSVEKLDHRARRQTVWSPYASSSAWLGCCSARTLCRTLDIYAVFRLQQKKNET